MRKYLYLLFVTLAFFAAFSARAQTINPTQPNPVQYIVSPETPGPGQSVQLEAQGIGTSLENATLTWEQNGVVVNSGLGDNIFNFTAGILGKQSVTHLIINSPGLGTIVHDFILSPSLVNLVWEADTTTPAFYRGKALYSGGAFVTVAAFPEISSQGVFIYSKALSFQWKLNDVLIPGQSGVGRSVFAFQGDQLKKSEDVAVDIYIGNTIVGHGEVIIPATTPQIVLYDRDPLRGEVLDAAFPTTINLTGQELTVEAEPYYFSNASKSDGSLTYSWTVNGSNTTGPDAQQGILTLLQNGSGVGTAVLNVSAQNTNSDQLVQAASASLQILFGQNTSNTSLFGL